MINEPLFKDIFGPAWELLPPVMHRHYANRPYSTDHVITNGTMNISLSWLARLFSPFLYLLGILVPYSGADIPVTVSFDSEQDSPAFKFDRCFLFPGKKPYHFHSSMVQIKDNDIIEWMRFGLGWRLHYLWDGQKVILQHQGYVLKIFGMKLKLPLDLVIGQGYAEEVALSDKSFRMLMHLTHPLFGKLFEYSGVFTFHD